jgi:SAM-dependent methyltransferase
LEAIEHLSPPSRVEFPSEWYELSTSDHFWFRWRLAACQEQLREIRIRVDAPLRALEVGCGSGILRGQLESCTAWTIDATDLNLAALRVAAPGRGRLLYYDVCARLPQFCSAYDVVIAYDVIEHLEDARSLLEAALWHLRPGGHLLLNVPAVPWLFSTYDTSAGHFRRYSPRMLEAEIAGLPAEVLSLRFWGLSLLPLLAIRKVILAGRRPSAKVIRTGFKPPGRVANALLDLQRRFEMAALPRPFTGASLLLAARKR